MIREGLAHGQRPSACLLHDPYAGYRDYDDPWWTPDPLLHTQWTDWDYALAEAIVALDMLTSQTGQPRWLTEDPDVYWEVGTQVDYGVKTLVEEADKYKDGMPRELTNYLKNPTKNGDFWTLEEWLDWRERTEDSAPLIDRGAPEGAHPPTAEEMAEMQRLRQERIAAKYAEAAEHADDDFVN